MLIVVTLGVFWLFVGWSCLPFFVFTSVELHHTAIALRTQEASAVSASPAVIRIASEHLHNDLARAIEALEHKKKKLPLVGPPCPCRLLPKFSAQKEHEVCSFQTINVLI